MNKLFLSVLFYVLCFNFYGQKQIKKNPFFSVASDYPGQFQLAFNTGYSKQTFPGLFYNSYHTPENYQNFVKKITNGFYNEIDLSYYFKRLTSLGIGIKYSKSFCGASATDISFDSDSKPVIVGNLEQHMNYGFLGPQISVRTLFLKKNMFYTKIALGSVYFNQHTLTSNPSLTRDFIMQSKSLGINFEYAYDYFISKNLALGMHISFGGGVFFDYTFIENNEESYHQFGDEHEIDLSPLDVGVGVRYNF